MKSRLFVIIAALVVVLSLAGLAVAAPDGPLSVLGLTVLPAPSVVGTTTTVNWDSDLSGTGTVTFRVYIPSDWYNSANWKAGTGVTVVQASALTYAVSACTDTTIGGVSVICAQYSADNSSAGEPLESLSLSFNLASSATVGANRPVRVSQISGSGGTPNISTIYVTVAGAPTTRYVANAGSDCGGSTPCDTGAGALGTAIAALPSAGGTIVVYGAYEANGAAIGAKNITLRAFDAAASLNAGSCTTSGNALVTLDGTGNLTVDGLTLTGDGASPAGQCFVGVNVTGGGNLTVQNSALIQNWQGDGISGGYGITVNGAGTHSITGSTFSTNGTGLNALNGTITVRTSTFDANLDGGVMVMNAGTNLTIENSTFSDTAGYGLFQYGGTTTLRGNTFSNNSNYAFVQVTGTTLNAYANNITGNNGGGYQAYVDTVAAAAKNWWGDAHNPAVGPYDGAGSFAAGWSRRLGNSVSAWVAGTNSATLGGASMSGGTGTAIIIDFGRGSQHAPFNVGIPPFVNQVCSDYYDYYVLPGGSGTWTVALPIDLSLTGCQVNVLFSEVAYTINPTSYDTHCVVSTDKACWDRIPATDVLADTINDQLLITLSTAQLGYTHIVAGDATGADPTAVTLRDLSAQGQPTSWALVLVMGVLVAGMTATGLILRRRALNA